MTLELTTSLFGPYRPTPGVRDALVDETGSVREHWTDAVGVLDSLGIDELRGRKAALDRMLDDEGVGYRIVDRGVTTRWPLDPLPAMITSAEWSEIERGVIERAVVLDLVLRDLYGDRELLERGLVPPEVVFAHPGFLRSCDGVALPTEQQLFTYAADIAYRSDGTPCVLADRTQAPSGAGYSLVNRIMVSRLFPSLYRDSQVHRVAPYFRSLRAGLESVAASATVDEPRIVVLTPGSQSETSFEHAYVGSYLGYPVVEGGDLTVRDGRVFLRALGTFEQVDVILRRVDADWCDPLELRPESQLGVPGLTEATRRGNVAVVNPLGSGVLENPGLLPFLPAITQHFVGREPALPAADTWWCGDPVGRSHVLARLDDIVVKPIGRGAGVSSYFGAELSEVERQHLRSRIEDAPHAWVGQEHVELATTPCFDGNGVAARPSVLRAFAVARAESYVVMSGGLTRTAPDAGGSPRISNQAGAESKDTWVLASEPQSMGEFWLRSGPPSTGTDASTLSPRAAENLFWLGRYAERAESSARLLRAVHDRREDAGPDVGECVRILLRAVSVMTGTTPGFTGPAGDDLVADPEPELLAVAADPERVGSLAYDVRHMLLAAEAVRDQLSQDTWLVVGSLEDELAALRHGSAQFAAVVQGRLGRVLQDLLALHGLAADSMVRDTGWHFMDAGRRIERAARLAALLRATITVQRDTATDSLLYESVLVAGESIITYRRRYRSRAQLETLLDLLVADPGNPRSLRHQVDRLAEDITHLPGGNVPGRPTAEERLGLELSTRLRTLDTAQVAHGDDRGERTQLDGFLVEVSGALADVAAAIAARSFVHMLPQRQFSTVQGEEP